jgi:small subunit ribosomal protein S20
MAHRRSSIKKIRIDKRRRAVNLRVISELKTITRRVHSLITAKNGAEASKESRVLISKLDKAVKKGVLHKNRASRLKSRLSVKIRSLEPKK